MTYRHPDPLIDAAMYYDDMDAADRKSEMLRDAQISEIDEVVKDLREYGVAKINGHYKTVCELIDELDCEFWQHAILPIYNFTETNPGDIVMRHNTIVRLTIDRIRGRMIERLESQT